MSLRLRFIDNETGLLIMDTATSDCSVSLALGKSGEWSTSLPAYIEAVQQINKGNLVEIYYQGSLLMAGYVQSYSGSLGEDGLVSLKGRDIVDLLYNYRAFSRALYKNTYFLQALGELLNTVGWGIGDISTLPAPLTTRVAVDLRGEKSLLPQIAALVAKVPNISYRYGGVVAGRHTLDVGIFSKSSGLSFYSPSSDAQVINSGNGFIDPEPTTGYIGKLTYTTTLEEIIWGLEATGGSFKDNTGAERNISLYDAVQNDPTLPKHPNYPVIEQLYKQTYFMFDLNRCKYPGGNIQIVQGAIDSYLAVGNSSASVANRSQQFASWFYPMPGRFKEFLFQTGTATIAGTITENFKWWIHEAGVFPTPGAVLASGDACIASAMVPDVRIRVSIPEDQQIIFEPGTEYVLRLGFDKPGGYPISTYKRLAGTAVTPTLLTTRQSNSLDNGVTWTLTDTVVVTLAIFTEQLSFPIGGTICETQGDIAPESSETNATLDDVKAAGTQLWQWGTAYLKDHSDNRTEYSLDVIGDVVLPQIGDTVYVRGHAEGTIVDPFTDSSETRTQLVEKTLRVDSIKVELGDDKREVSFGLTEGNGITNQDVFVQMYDVTKPVERPKGRLVPMLLNATMASSTVTVGVVYPDTEMSDGRPAKLVNLVYPTPPSASRNVPLMLTTPFGVSSRGDVFIEIVTPLNPVTSTGITLRMCVEQGWVYSDSVDLTVLYLWY
jgi:hypothetical protein